MHLRAIGVISFLCAVLGPMAGASTIVQSSGDSEATVPLGYYAPYGTATVYGVSWSQSSAYSNVAVFANLFNVGGGGTVDYTLATAIGPASSFAADGIIRGSVTLPASPTDVELFTLPKLAAGTYYLVLDSPTANSGWQYGYPFQPNYTTAPGVTYRGGLQAQFGNIDSAYTAGSSFSGISYPVEFSVTGNAAAAPEPNLLIGIGLVLLGMVTLLQRRGQTQGAGDTPGAGIQRSVS
jgi:hypothetical protein